MLKPSCTNAEEIVVFAIVKTRDQCLSKIMKVMKMSVEMRRLRTEHNYFPIDTGHKLNVIRPLEDVQDVF